jgi:hypothetical protein
MTMRYATRAGEADKRSKEQSGLVKVVVEGKAASEPVCHVL